jgi:serine/threonine protein kinase
VALKFCLHPVAADSLRNEATLHDHLDRVRQQGGASGIVPLLETYLRADPPCLMYELIEGGDLAGLIQELHPAGRLPPELATRIVQKLASTVAFAHRLDPPLVHRDLKPSNILVRRGESGKAHFFVADFGIGGLAAQQALQALQEQAGRDSVRGQTLPTAVRGAYTPLYASPQQVQGERPDPRDDVHALGVIWYQLVTGDLKLVSIPPDWRDVVQERGLDKERVEVLASCIASRAEKRPASAAELVERLARFSVHPPTDQANGGDKDQSPTEGETKGTRKELTLKVLRRHGIVSEGTEIEPIPDAMPEDGLERDPKLFRARIGSKQSIIWEHDGDAYSLTELSVILWQQHGLLWVRPKTFELWRIAGQAESMWHQADKLRMTPSPSDEGG